MTRFTLLLLLTACAPVPANGPALETHATNDDATPTADDPLVVGDACDAYMDCLAETDADAFADVLDQFGTDGSCWEGGDAERCDRACASGLEEVREGNGELVPSCMLGASDDEILEMSRRLCPVQVPSEVDPDDVPCVVDAVLACEDDATDAIAECVFEEPVARNTSFEEGVWDVTYTPDLSAEDMHGCELSRRFQVRIEGDGDTVTRFDILTPQGGTAHRGECSEETDVICYFGQSKEEAFVFMGNFSDPTTLDADAWSYCGVWGTIEGTFVH